MRIPICIVVALILVIPPAASAQTTSAIAVADTIFIGGKAPFVRSGGDVDDILEAVALKAGIVKQGDNMPM